MAEDFRGPDSDRDTIVARRRAIIAECRRQEESCLFTSTTLFVWLRRVRWQSRAFVAAPLVLGGLAGLSVLQEWLPDWSIAILAFLASLFPALADGLKIETSVAEIARLAAAFKLLQDRFRRHAEATPFCDVEVADERLTELMDQMDIARSHSVTPPDWAFEKARKKINEGHYTFAVDEIAPPVKTQAGEGVR